MVSISVVAFAAAPPAIPTEIPKPSIAPSTFNIAPNFNIPYI